MQLTASSSKIKLLIAVPSLECGGLERNVTYLCNLIDNTKFDTTLVVINNSKPFYQISNNAIDIIDLNKKKVSQSVREIIKIIAAKKPDIVLSTANHLNLLLAMAKPFLPGKFKFIARESSIVSINTKRNRFPALFDFLLKCFYRKYDLIICQSAYMCKDLMAHYKIPLSKTIVINNMVEMPEIISPDIQDVSAVPQLFTVGRLSEEKGIDRIIKSLCHVKKKFHYTIIGDGPERKNLEKLVKHLGLQHCIRLEGASDRPYTKIGHPAFFLMGSHYEGFPNVLLEANALGIPVVAFDAPGGISEVVNNFENGILVENGNEEKFAQAIEQAMGYDFDRQAIQQSTKQKYGASYIISRWEDTLVSLFSGPENI